MLVSVNGIDLHYDVHGTGEPLLFLHGGMGCGSDWRHVFTEIPDGFRLIAPDLRGHGRTTHPGGEVTFRQLAADIAALLAHLEIERVKAIGISGGGIVLLHLATATPSLIASMVVVSAPACFPEQARRIQRQFSPAMLSEADLARLRQVHVHGEAQIARLFDWVHDMAQREDDVNFSPALLATIAAETLIVFGDRDPLYPVSVAVDLKTAIPKSFLWVVPNGGHGPVFGAHAARFAETASAFLRSAWRESHR